MTGVEITSPERATTVSPSWTGSGSQRASPGPTTRHVDGQAARGDGLLDHAGLLGQPERTEAFGRPGGEPLDGRRPGRLLRVGHDDEALDDACSPPIPPPGVQVHGPNAIAPALAPARTAPADVRVA